MYESEDGDNCHRHERWESWVFIDERRKRMFACYQGKAAMALEGRQSGLDCLHHTAMSWCLERRASTRPVETASSQSDATRRGVARALSPLGGPTRWEKQKHAGTTVAEMW